MKRMRLSLLFLPALLFFSSVNADELSDDQARYAAFVEQQSAAVPARSEGESLRDSSIFFLTADMKEFYALEAVIDQYFDALRTGTADLQTLRKKLRVYDVEIVGNCQPLAYYHIRHRKIFIDSSFFSKDANPVYTKAVLYHEKVHQNQVQTFDPRVLKLDQQQHYCDKLEEIAAHYLEIKFAIQKQDREAALLVLDNSRKERMLPNILNIYPTDDPVVEIINYYLQLYESKSPEVQLTNYN